MDDRVRVERAEGIAEVRLVRADKHNGLDHRMFQALLEAGRGLLDDPGLRAVVLSGEGPSFCAGLDFASFMREGIDPATVLRAEEGSPANFAQRVAWIWRELPVPVIAALHGHVYGGGLQLALAADLRYVTPDAKLSVREIHWGLVPDMSGTQTLRHLVRLDVAKELTYTGRAVSGVEAVALGLATRVEEDPRAAALAIAREIAGRSPDAIRGAKRLLDASVTLSPEEGLRLEEAIQRTILGKPNQLEAVAAGMSKRAPKFRDPQ
ncbi:MAG: crotonase/enoyl-CoA hydratase family protein [Myxococcales bacterium]|nr:crotonase/enoyl-CoA hydratase family protein [Myxococcales bacterium]MCB9714199.1 crotonase/enoyl-CoA hydratase family protein [Myxococcales bacterium]